VILLALFLSNPQPSTPAAPKRVLHRALDSISMRSRESAQAGVLSDSDSWTSAPGLIPGDEAALFTVQPSRRSVKRECYRGSAHYENGSANSANARQDASKDT